ncbi:MAG: hypothetical protein AABW68_01795 [archaeon]
MTHASPSRIPSWAQLVLFLLLVLGAGVTAYSSGLPPNVLGHTSDEIAFGFQKVEADCTNAPFLDPCVASCSSLGPGYQAIGGSCFSNEGYQWNVMGIAADSSAWNCWDGAHFVGTAYRATAWCSKVG